MTSGRYEMLAPIAAGGMASVWAARLRGAAGFSKIVAIKSMLPELADEAEYRAMFLDEARVASKLRHPNVCETFDLHESDGALFMAMEWVDGVSVHRLLRSGEKQGMKEPRASKPIAPELATRIIASACAGLHAAHEAVDDDGTPLAIVHRDVSPQNLLVSSDGHVKVTDFGVAMARGKRHATAAGQAKGKLAYMAPEQLRGGPIDRRADVFSLGSVLYELTTGHKPFEAPSDAQVMRAILERAPTRPSALLASYPLELERIIVRAMTKDPHDRFASAEGLRIALERWLATLDAKVTEREVAVLVHERCGAEIEARRAHIHSLSTELQPEDLVDVSADTHLAHGSRRPTDRGRAFTMGLGLLVIAFAFGSLWWRNPIATEVVMTPSAPIAPAIVEAPPAIAPREAVRPAASAIATAVTFRLEPPEARLVVDGDPLEPGTDTVDRPAEGEMRVVLVKAPGHIDRLIVVDHGSPGTVEVSLAPAEPSVLSAR